MSVLGNLSRIVVVSVFIAACASPWGNESAEMESQDSPEALRIKTALIEAPGLAGSALDVRYEDGRVHLSGFVETTDQRNRAEAIAHEQEGVTEVVNDITVK